MERDLVKGLTFSSSKFAGTQQISLDIGHALFGARFEYGDPLFSTVSPSSRHSKMVLRFSRYRYEDPAVKDTTNDVATTRGSGLRASERTSQWCGPCCDTMIRWLPRVGAKRRCNARLAGRYATVPCNCAYDAMQVVCAKPQLMVGAADI